MTFYFFLFNAKVLDAGYYKKQSTDKTIPKKHWDEKDSEPSCVVALMSARGTFHCPESLTAYWWEVSQAVATNPAVDRSNNWKGLS